jgi:general nucleoside transport system permease protein
LASEADQLEQDAASRLRGAFLSLLTTFLAFLVGGLVVALTGKSPFRVYKAIFDGTGLSWFFHIPWDTSSVAASNLQQTLLLTTPIILCGLAAAFAFRSGLFNIGGQGQYFAGSYFAIWLGTSFTHLNPFLHVVVCLVAGALAGGVWAAIAGALKATVGAHEVITTIMLNWIAIWVGSYLFGAGGPLQNSNPSIAASNSIVSGAKLPVFWGPRELQGLSIGIFIAAAMLVVYWIVVNRTTLGFSLRAAGFNPDAARYAGMPVARNIVVAMGIAGALAGLAGAIDVTGWEFQLGPTDLTVNQLGFIGLAAALLGRSTTLGVGASSLLFGALINGTSSRQLDPTIFKPELATNLSTIIQGLVILFVGLNLAGIWTAIVRRRGRA